jgi:hypothetical protein
MLKRILLSLASLISLSVSIFFLYVIHFLFSSEISPAIENGSLNIETSSRILNRVWVGNEIYIILGIYALLACAFGYGAIRVGKRALQPESSSTKD